MADDSRTLEKLVLTRLMRLNEHIHGVAFGFLAGLGVFMATNWLVLKGGPVGPEGEPLVGPHLSLLGQFFWGYTVTFTGSLIGFAYTFVLAYLAGYLIAKLYNWIVDHKENRNSDNYSG